MKKSMMAISLSLLAAATGAHAQTLDKIKSSGTLLLGVRESSGALAYTLGNGKYAGFHTEMAERIARDVQKQLGLANLEIKYQPITSGNRVPLMQNGTIDLECGSTTNNTARQRDVAFAYTTYVTEVRTLVKASSGINSIAQLAGKTVATTTGTTSVQHLRKHEKGAGVEFKELYGKDHADSFLLLDSGRADAFVMDDYIVAAMAGNSKAPGDYKMLPEVLSVEPIACMLRKDDATFKKAVDDSIAGMIKSGDMAKLYDKWMMQPVPPTNNKLGLPLSEATKAAWANPNTRPAEEYVKK